MLYLFILINHMIQSLYDPNEQCTAQCMINCYDEDMRWMLCGDEQWAVHSKLCSLTTKSDIGSCCLSHMPINCLRARISRVQIEKTSNGFILHMEWPLPVQTLSLCTCLATFCCDNEAIVAGKQVCFVLMFREHSWIYVARGKNQARDGTQLFVLIHS